MIDKIAKKDEQEKSNIYRSCIPHQNLQVEIHLVEHCNLNCQMCLHYSPLAEPKYLSLETFASDMVRLRQLFDNKVKHIMLLGGEPLLHPNLCPFFEVTRQNFPKTEIILYTNGLRLPFMNNKFWESCRNNNITFILTKYPINFDYSKIDTLMAKNDITFKYCNTPGRNKHSSHFPLDLKGTQNIQENFHSCTLANRCIFLKNGRLYTCNIIPNIQHFNEYYNQNLEVSSSDSIDIYEAKNDFQIMQFLASPVPFCRYCDVNHRTFDHEWAISKHNINEWTL